MALDGRPVYPGLNPFVRTGNSSHDRAMTLLRSFLTSEQLKELESEGYFTVRGSQGGIYHINVTGGITGNVKKILGRPFGSLKGYPAHVEYCAYVPETPHPDTWLIQKLTIEADEELWLERARRYGPYCYPSPLLHTDEKSFPMNAPVNLLDNLDEESSHSYIRRIMARVLGHAIADGLEWKDARSLWEQVGCDPDRWHMYIPWAIEAAQSSA